MGVVAPGEKKNHNIILHGYNSPHLQRHKIFCPFNDVITEFDLFYIIVDHFTSAGNFRFTSFPAVRYVITVMTSVLQASQEVL